MSLASNTNTHLQDLIGVGSDAMSNLYYLEFSGSFLDGDTDLKVGMRVRTKDFAPPTFSQNQKNTVHYMTVSEDLPVPAVSGEKSLSLNIRLDENYEVYSFLLRQQAVTSIANLGYAGTDVPDSENGGFRIDVYAFDRGANSDLEATSNPDDLSGYKKLYNFEYCWVKSISGLNYTYDSPSPITLTVNIGFFAYDDPMNLLLGV